MSPRRSSTLGISYGDMPCSQWRTRTSQSQPRTQLTRFKIRKERTHLQVGHDAADDRAVADEEDVGRFAFELEDDGLEAVRQCGSRCRQSLLLQAAQRNKTKDATHRTLRSW